MATDCLPRRLPDEPQRVLGRHDVHLMALADQAPDQMYRLVCGDSARDPDDNEHAASLPRLEQEPPCAL